MVLSRDKRILRKIATEDVDIDGCFKVPDGVKVIGEGAGGNKQVCKKLTFIDINEVEQIQAKAFRDNAVLETVVGSPKSIGDYAFCGCIRLKEINLSEVEDLGREALSRTNITKADISKADIISKMAFANCQQLETVVGAPRIISYGAFWDCKKLKAFDFSNVTALSDFSFCDSGLEKVDISYIQRIPNSAFEGCINLRTVIGAPTIIGDFSFNHCVELKEFDFSNVKRIGAAPFLRSGISETESPKEVCIHYKNRNILFARIERNRIAYRISNRINEHKNAYVDLDGCPFILNSNGIKVSLLDNKGEFLALWNAS